MEQAGANSQVGLGVATIIDGDGASLGAEINAALEKTEAAIQLQMCETGDNLPEKPYIITARIEVTPKGQYSRQVDFEVELKAPKIVMRHTMLARSTNGKLTIKPDTQMQLDMQREVAKEKAAIRAAAQ